jgi:3-dehydroquinate synthase
MPKEPVTVTHALGSYPVYVESGALSRLDRLIGQHLPGRRIIILADATVLELYRAGQLGAPPSTAEALSFPAGEPSKSRETWARLTDQLFELGADRGSAIVSLGGGVAGDLAGFVAATYMRGIPYVQVPTTLLAMVDASVGGKTAVDTPRGKNLVGAFHQPAAVMADPLTLQSLPDRTFREGLAEAVKHGLIADRAYFEWIESHAEAIERRDPETLTGLIRRSVEIKAHVVGADERETGCRAILNAGHTVAHALEQVSGYGLAHGEAVALGLAAECHLAEQLGVARPGLGTRVTGLLTRLGLPVRLNHSVNPEPLLQAMLADKKNRKGEIHCSLVAELGRMHRAKGWTVPVPGDAIRHALEVLA